MLNTLRKTDIETEPDFIETIGFPSVHTTKEMHHDKQDVLKNLSFDCSVCDKNNLKAHISVKHESQSNDQPLKCSCCFNEFKYHSNLMTHEGTHTKDKQFSCSHCTTKPQSNNSKYLSK